MHQLKLYLIASLLAYASFSIAQDSSKPIHELGFTYFTWERNIETQNNPLSLKLLPGVYYAHHFKDWAWVNNFYYGNNKIDDNCTGCGDQFYGIGNMKEWLMSTSIRRYMFQQKHFKVQPFLELGGYFSHLRYSGDFEGGRSGGGYRFDHKYWTTGIIGRFGLTYSPNQLLTLSAYTSYKVGRRANVYGDVSRRKALGGSLVQFAVGYRF